MWRVCRSIFLIWGVRVGGVFFLVGGRDGRGGGKHIPLQAYIVKKSEQET